MLTRMKKTCAGLAEEGNALVLEPEGAADVDEEQHDVGGDADRPRPDKTFHAEVGRGDADRDADQLEPVELVLPDGDVRVDDRLEDVLRRVSGRNEGVHEGCSSFGFVVLLGRTPGTCTTGGPGVDRPPAQPSCCLPSGLSPSVQELHLVNRPLAAVGSRTVTAGSEFHRPRSTWLPVCRSRGAVRRGRLACAFRSHPKLRWTRRAGRCSTDSRARAHPRPLPRPRPLVAVAVACARRSTCSAGPCTGRSTPCTPPWSGPCRAGGAARRRGAAS